MVVATVDTTTCGLPYVPQRVHVYFPRFCAPFCPAGPPEAYLALIPRCFAPGRDGHTLLVTSRNINKVSVVFQSNKKMGEINEVHNEVRYGTVW